MVLSHFPCLLVMHFAFVSVLLLAGQGRLCHFSALTPCTNVTEALSLSIAVGGSVGTVDATQFLNVTDAYLLTDVRQHNPSLFSPSNRLYQCQTQCSNANAQITVCPVFRSLPYLTSFRPVQPMIPVSALPTQSPPSPPASNACSPT